MFYVVLSGLAFVWVACLLRSRFSVALIGTLPEEPRLECGLDQRCLPTMVSALGPVWIGWFRHSKNLPKQLYNGHHGICPRLSTERLLTSESIVPLKSSNELMAQTEFEARTEATKVVGPISFKRYPHHPARYLSEPAIMVGKIICATTAEKISRGG